MELVWDIYYAVLKDGSLIVDKIYTERLFGAATKKTDKTLLRVLRFLKATALFGVFIFCFFLWSGLFCCVSVPGTLALNLLYTLINCDCLVCSVSQSVTT